MVTGGIVSTFLPQPVNPLTLFSQKVKIESVNIGTQQCNPVELTGFRVDGNFISYAAFSNEGWTREDTRMIAGTAENYLEWKGYARNIVISLAGREEGCSARISINGTPSEYSTYSDPTEEILVHLEFSQPDWISWLTGTAIGFLASAMFLFLFSIFHRIFVWSGISDRIRSFKTIEQKDVHLIYLLIVISMAGYLYFTHTFNLLFEGDSGSYISAGYSLAAGNGYIADNGDDFDWWPPLYPILISGGYRQHAVDVDIYLRLLHSVLFMLTGTGSFVLFRLNFPDVNRWMHLVFTIVILFSAPVLGCFEYILSEAAFIPVVIWSFVFLWRFDQTRSFRSLLAFSLCISTSALIRYIGIIGLLTGVFFIFLLQNVTVIRRGVLAGAFGLISAFPEVLWLIRNLFVTGNITGLRTASEFSLQAILDQTLNTITSWFYPNFEVLAAVIISTGLALPAAIFVYRMFSGERTFFQSSNEDTVIKALLFYCAAYLVFFWFSLTVVANSTVSDRFLAPVYVPVIILILFSIRTLKSSRARRDMVLQTSLSGLLLLSLAVPTINHLVSLQTTTYNSYVFLPTAKIKNDRLINFLKQHPPSSDKPIVTNCPDCLNYSLHLLNLLYINDEMYSDPFLRSAEKPFSLILFSHAELPFGMSETDWGINSNPNQIAETLKRISGKRYSIDVIESNPDGIWTEIYP